MYIYVSRDDGLARVPAALLDKFGEPELALTFVLTPERRLARHNGEKVFRNLVDQGYHLQMPPIDLGFTGRTSRHD